jgi:hypothetical protein
MLRRISGCLVLLTILLLVSSLSAQSEPKSKKEQKYPTVAGYQMRKMAGFAVFVHDDVLNQDTTSEKLKPVDALELELKNIVKMMPKRHVEILQSQVPVWINWELKEKLSNGRPGNAAGLYMGIYPRPIVVDGKQINVSGVRILLANEIVQRLQKNPDAPPSTLLLHEFAHAVHHLSLGWEYAPVKVAYQTSMERKLYDNSLYMTTNEREFFAELSCSYLMRLQHFPKNSEELKKHDPATFKILETVWGKRNEKDSNTSAPQTEFDLDLSWSDFVFDTANSLKEFDPKSASGRVKVLYHWDPTVGESLFGLIRLNVLFDELRDYRAVMVGAGGFPGKDIRFVNRGEIEWSDLTAAAKIRGIAFPLVKSAKAAKANDCRKLPHCTVFNSEGKCLFRGTPFEAETVIRATLNQSVIADANREKFSAPVAPIVKSMEAGEPTPAMMKKLVQIAQTNDGIPLTEAKALLEQLVKPGREQIKAAEEILKSDPLGAYLILDRIATVFKGTSLARQADGHIEATLKHNKAVAAEIRAKSTLELVRKLDVALSSRPQSFDPSLSEFQRANADLLNQLKVQVEKLKKSFPDTKAAAEGVFVAEKFSVKVK